MTALKFEDSLIPQTNTIVINAENVEYDRHAKDVWRGGKCLFSRGAIILRQPVRNMNAEITQQAIEKLGPANRDRDVADRILDD